VGDFVTLWAPDQAAFELGGVTIRGSVSCDLNLCDSDASNPIAFVSLSVNRGFDGVKMGLGVIRSVNPRASRLLLVDAIGVGVPVTVKGMVYGWRARR
jgi:hypothetical protein